MTNQWNPENPFIINPYYFVNVTSTRYEQTWMSTFHHINNMLAGSLGLFASLTVIYLVLNKTPRQFKPYSKIILLCSCVDLYFVLVDYIIQLRMKISQGMLAFAVVGPLSKASYWWQSRAVCFFCQCILATYTMLPFQYFYRYSTIKNKRPPSLFQIIAYLSFGALVVGIVLVTSTLAYCILNNEEEKREYAMYWYAEVPVPQLTFGIHANPFVAIHLSYFMVVTVVCYTATISLARKTVTLLRQYALQMSPKTLELQNQFGMALFAQALIPLLSAGPVVLAIVTVFFQVETGAIGEYIIMSITWFPCFNSLSTLVFISPYRNFCLKPFKRIIKKPTGGPSSVSVVPVNK